VVAYRSDSRIIPVFVAEVPRVNVRKNICFTKFQLLNEVIQVYLFIIQYNLNSTDLFELLANIPLCCNWTYKPLCGYFDSCYNLEIYATITLFVLIHLRIELHATLNRMAYRFIDYRIMRSNLFCDWALYRAGTPCSNSYRHQRAADYKNTLYFYLF
jgi:hypothetical protein